MRKIIELAEAYNVTVDDFVEMNELQLDATYIISTSDGEFYCAKKIEIVKDLLSDILDDLCESEIYVYNNKTGKEIKFKSSTVRIITLEV